jgi:hypothetical protein
VVPDLVRRQPVISALAIATLLGWSIYGFVRGAQNTAFYLGWMLATYALVLYLDRGRPFSSTTLGGLAAWGFMHMAGGILPVGSGVLYQHWILPFLRYDQLTHAIGFGFAGLAVREQFGRWLPHQTRAAAATLVVLGGIAAGGVNEMLEFLLTRVATNTNVGGFENTGWDLVANTVGSSVAAGWAARRAAS